jgi:hypothetical protein
MGLSGRRSSPGGGSILNEVEQDHPAGSAVDRAAVG